MRRRLSLFGVLTLASGGACGGLTAQAGADDAADAGGQAASDGSVGWGGIGMPMAGADGNVDGPSTGGNLPSGTGGETSPPDALDDWLADDNLEGPYEDERPDAPTEYLAPLPLGTAGWRQSSTPICSSLTDIVEADIWADEAGVALLAHAPRCNPGDDPCGPFGSELWYNDGAGWKWLWGTTAQGVSLAGIRDGDLLLGGPPGVLAIGRDGLRSGRTPAEAGEALGLVGAGSLTAYTLLAGDTEAEEQARLYRFQGGDWIGLGRLPSDVLPWILYGAKLAVAEESVYLPVGFEVYRAHAGDDFEPMTNVPEEKELSAVADDHLWAANSARQILHYDGDSWEIIGGFSPPIRGFWNDGETAYFVSEHQFGKAAANLVEIILQEDSLSFHSITGTSSNEVFVTMRDAALTGYACDTLLVAVYDGEEFHRF